MSRDGSGLTVTVNGPEMLVEPADAEPAPDVTVTTLVIVTTTGLELFAPVGAAEELSIVTVLIIELV